MIISIIYIQFIYTEHQVLCGVLVVRVQAHLFCTFNIAFFLKELAQIYTRLWFDSSLNAPGRIIQKHKYIL